VWVGAPPAEADFAPSSLGVEAAGGRAARLALEAARAAARQRPALLRGWALLLPPGGGAGAGDEAALGAIAGACGASIIADAAAAPPGSRLLAVGAAAAAAAAPADGAPVARVSEGVFLVRGRCRSGGLLGGRRPHLAELRR